ncbi:MAG: PatB family C-S lyase [Anaerolineae bacterium]|nr:PatB family C-S lyase [Anaerolineae bacterium]
MRYDFDQFVDRRGTECYKWDGCDEDVLPLPVADMDYVSPEPVVRALRERVDHGVFGYTLPAPALYDVVQARLKSLYGWEVAAEEILFLPGVVVGFNLACHAVGAPGDGVLIQPPVYGPFLGAPGNARRTTQAAEVPLAGDRYEIDYDVLQAAIVPRTRTFLFCNPHNPIGRVYERRELERLAEICLRHDLVICSDEIHCDLVFRGHPHTPIASLSPEVARRTITLMAPSKTYNIAGLHCSFAVIQDPALREQFRGATAGLVSSVNALGYTAALAAYSEGQEWLDQVLVYLEANRDYLVRYVAEHLPGIQMVVPEGTYLAWLDCRSLGLDEEPSAFFLREARVSLGAGGWFGAGGEGFVRLNFACTRGVLAEALSRMANALARAAG